MIGVSDGTQFETSFEHTIASRMPPGSPTEPTGAPIEEARYPGSPKPLGPPQSHMDPMGPSFTPDELEMQKHAEPGNREFDVKRDNLAAPKIMSMGELQNFLFGRSKSATDPVDPKGTFKDEPTEMQKFRDHFDTRFGQGEEGQKGAIHPDRFLEDQGYRVPQSDMSPSSQGDRMDRNPKWGSEQQRQFEPESIKKNINLDPRIASILSHPDVANAILNPKIDRSHDVPYEAGASAKPNDFTTHIDKHIPSEVTLDGVKIDPAIPANIHEQVEREVMQNLIKKGMSNERAYQIAHHEFAEPAEDAWYQHHGISVEAANKWWGEQDKTTEKEGKLAEGEYPPDLYKKPYPHNEVEGEKHEPSGVAKEWPIRL